MGSKGYLVGMPGAHARIRGGGLDPIGKAHVILVDLDLDLTPRLIPLTKFPGSAHGGGGQFISLECIRTDCLMEDQARG